MNLKIFAVLLACLFLIGGVSAGAAVIAAVAGSSHGSYPYYGDYLNLPQDNQTDFGNGILYYPRGDVTAFCNTLRDYLIDHPDMRIATVVPVTSYGYTTSYIVVVEKKVYTSNPTP